MFDQLCQDIIDGYRAKGLTLATAESCTGGLLSGALTGISGSSDVFERGFVTYSYPSKTDLLGVPQAMLAEHGAVSLEVAAAMALGAQKASLADIAVSVTGVAGPGASDNKPEGMVCFGLAGADGSVETAEMQFGALGRKAVREASVGHALSMLAGQITP